MNDSLAAMARVNFPGNSNSHQKREKRIKKTLTLVSQIKLSIFLFLSLLELDVSPNPMIKVFLTLIMKAEKKEKWRFCKYYLLLFSANRLRFSRSCFFEKSRELEGN